MARTVTKAPYDDMAFHDDHKYAIWANAAMSMRCVFVVASFFFTGGVLVATVVRQHRVVETCNAQTQNTMTFNNADHCSAYLDLARDALVGVVIKKPSFDESGQPEIGRKSWPWCVGCVSMTGTRIDNVRKLVLDVVTKNIPGDFLEVGARRGGSSIMARLIQKCMNTGSQRTVHVCDSFQGRPRKRRSEDWLLVSMDAVAGNFRAMGALDDGVRFYKGDAQHTLPSLRLQFQKEGRKIAVLRGDKRDDYAVMSYWDILYNMYEFVPIGGYFICDDCPRAGTMKIVDAFRRKHGIEETMQKAGVSSGGMYWRKEKDVAVKYSDYVAWNKTRT